MRGHRPCRRTGRSWLAMRRQQYDSSRASQLAAHCWLSPGMESARNEYSKVGKKMPMLSLGLRMGFFQTPLSLYNFSIWVLSTLPGSSELGGVLLLPDVHSHPRGSPSRSPPPSPNVHRRARGWPICDRSEVDAGLGKGAAQSGTGGAGHTVGFLSNWKPGAQ